MKRIKILDIITIINIMFIGWITVSTLQVSLRIGTPQAWNCWNIFLKLMEWRMAL